MYISITGNIGTGKTSLTHLLAQHLQYIPHYENIEHNPYIHDFYHNMKKWAFHLQIFFLSDRFKQIKSFETKKNIIQDRTIYEDAYIFTANLNQIGHSRDYQAYLLLFELIKPFITPPNLLIYLRASVPTLISQIKKRRRQYENTIEHTYLP